MLNFFGPCLSSYLGSVAFLELLTGHRFFFWIRFRMGNQKVSFELQSLHASLELSILSWSNVRRTVYRNTILMDLDLMWGKIRRVYGYDTEE